MIPKGSADCNPSHVGLRQCHTCTLPEYMGTVSGINVCDHIVGATIAKFSAMTSPPSYELLLIDAITGAELLFDPKLPQVSVLDYNPLIQLSIYVAFYRPLGALPW
jgi:hypothetical protein